jgi:hypothetical protein
VNVEIHSEIVMERVWGYACRGRDNANLAAVVK